MLTSLDVLLDSFYNRKKRWLTSIAIAVSATLANNITALTEKPTRFSRGEAPPKSMTLLANGVYLYGETARPNVVGKEYIIFETIGTKTRGAFYLPRSEFSCFYGQLRGASLNVTLIDPFDRQKYSFILTVHPNGLTASKQQRSGQPTYQPLTKISANDRRILAACKLQLPQ